MLWPTLCVDNFFVNPEEIRKYALSLEYNPTKDGRWPGKRTKNLFNINQNFHIFLTAKILKLLYPTGIESLGCHAEAYFQKINGNLHSQSGWVHKDNNEFTTIVYLSHHKNCGTSIFDKKNIEAKAINEQIRKEENIKAEFENKKIEEDSKGLISNNSQFEKTITFNSKFNRLILFDAAQFHAAEKFNEVDVNEDRLTLILFFYNIFSQGEYQIKFHLSEMNRFL